MEPDKDAVQSRDELEVLYQKQNEVGALMKHGLPFLKKEFFDRQVGWIKRAKSSTSTGESNGTCTAFTLYYLLRARLIASDAAGKKCALTQADTLRALEGLQKQVIRSHLSVKHSFTTTGPLPNEYNSPLYAAGLLRTAEFLKFRLSGKGRTACKKIIRFITRQTVGKKRRYLTRLNDPDTPSAYFSYWASAALKAWAATNPADQDSVTPALTSICDWAESEAARAIAFHEAKVFSEFDIIELLYAIVIFLEFGPTSERCRLADKGLSILFEHHFSNGCFGPSTPVLADQRNFSLLCPAAEGLALLLETSSPTLFPFSERFLEVFAWLRDHLGRGWVSEWAGRNGEPTGFMTASALTFLSKLHRFLDNLLAHRAASILKVSRFIADEKIAKIPYPSNLEDTLKNHVIGPLKEPRSSALASYSMILYGPPGSAKTTLAKKIANDLHWPLLVLNQSEFLRSGLHGINAEAERIFRLAFFLKDTVILFDEVEELVQEREKAEQISRLLTTAMLPRIHDLRDRRRVVFIFATNHVEGIDRAAARLGRFDILKCVLPPSKKERRAIFKQQLSDFHVPPRMVQTFKELKLVEATENFGYMDIVALVKNVMVDYSVQKPRNVKALVKQRLRIAERAVSKDLVDTFRRKSEEVDRP